MRKPCIQLYTRDWLTTPELRVCKPAARGLWLDLMCLACLEEPIGYVTVNGKPATVEDIVNAIAGWTIELVKEALEDLRIHGVFSVDRKGRVYSRRMVRAEKLGAISKENGKKGGNPTLRKQTQNRSGDNPLPRARAANAVADAEEDKKEGKVDTSQKEALGAAGKPNGKHPVSEFESWYQAYPLKQARGAAERAFNTARKIATLAELVAGVDRYKANKHSERHWKYPATWLNGKCWLDEPEPELFGATGPPSAGRRYVDEEEQRNAEARAFLQKVIDGKSD